MDLTLVDLFVLAWLLALSAVAGALIVSVRALRATPAAPVDLVQRRLRARTERLAALQAQIQRIKAAPPDQRAEVAKAIIRERVEARSA